MTKNQTNDTLEEFVERYQLRDESLKTRKTLNVNDFFNHTDADLRDIHDIAEDEKRQLTTLLEGYKHDAKRVLGYVIKRLRDVVGTVTSFDLSQMHYNCKLYSGLGSHDAWLHLRPHDERIIGYFKIFIWFSLTFFFFRID